SGGGVAHPRPYRPHLVRTEGVRHLRLPGIHSSRGPVHADRPHQRLRPAAGAAAAGGDVPRAQAGHRTGSRRRQDRPWRDQRHRRPHARPHPGIGGLSGDRRQRDCVHRRHPVRALGGPDRPVRWQRPRPDSLDRRQVVGARRQNSGPARPRQFHHHWRGTALQPVPRRPEPMSDFSAFSAPRGVPDYVPPDSARFVAVRSALLDAARRAGYSDVELPIFEDTALFARGVGESTDVVTKEMYTFTDRGDRSVTLRPEGTATVVRAVIEHRLDRGALPVKLCYAGPFFRYERPQAGRYRQMQQVGVEAIGVDDPALDAEVIAIADGGFRSLGLDGFRLEITSLGDDSCRPQYRELLQDFLFKLDLDEETRKRAEINPLRVLDDKRPAVKELT